MASCWTVDKAAKEIRQQRGKRKVHGSGRRCDSAAGSVYRLEGQAREMHRKKQGKMGHGCLALNEARHVRVYMQIVRIEQERYEQRV